VKLAELMGAMRFCWTSHEWAHEKKNDAVIFEYYKPGVKFKNKENEDYRHVRQTSLQSRRKGELREKLLGLCRGERDTGHSHELRDRLLRRRLNL
jgi:hypothetical protein